MPQMAPMLWLILFFVFIFSLLLFSIMNYFMVSQKMSYPVSSFSLINQNLWKW